jgi:hypothetical protein
MDRLNGNRHQWYLYSCCWVSMVRRHGTRRTERGKCLLPRQPSTIASKTGGWVFRRSKLTLSCSAEGKEGILVVVRIVVAVAPCHRQYLNYNIPLQKSIFLFYNHFSTLHIQSWYKCVCKHAIINGSLWFILQHCHYLEFLALNGRMIHE